MEQVSQVDLDPDDRQTPPSAADSRVSIDTSRPFRSVKEAVAIFGERVLVGDIYSPKTFTFPQKEVPFFSPSPKIYSPPSPRGSSNYSQDPALSDAVKKLEAELEDTKAELKLLKERETETEAALASLNVELQRNMSKLASAEAEAETAKPVAADGGAVIIREEEKKRDEYLNLESKSLAQILSIGESEGLFVGRKKEKKVMKKKPIIPLVGDLFSRKKATSAALHHPLYTSSLN